MQVNIIIYDILTYLVK